MREEGVSAIEKFIPVHAALLELERERNAAALGRDPLYARYALPYALCIGKVGAGDWASSVAESLLDYSPGRAFGVGPENEPKGILSQWYRWNRTRRWTGRDGFDYLAALRDLTVPTLCLAGAGDRWIAPAPGCRRLFDALGSRDKEWILCAKSEGFTEDFGHARLIASRAAQREVWPRIRDWLVART